MDQFPDMSPYVAFANNPVFYTDPFGLAPGGTDPPPVDGTEDQGDRKEMEGASALFQWEMQCGTTCSSDDQWLKVVRDMPTLSMNRFEFAIWREYQKAVQVDPGAQIKFPGEYSMPARDDRGAVNIESPVRDGYITVYATISPKDWPEKVSSTEKTIPLWGNGKSAIVNFSDGNWRGGIMSSIGFVTDVAFTKSLVTGGSRYLGTMIAKRQGISNTFSGGARLRFNLGGTRNRYVPTGSGTSTANSFGRTPTWTSKLYTQNAREVYFKHALNYRVASGKINLMANQYSIYQSRVFGFEPVGKIGPQAMGVGGGINQYVGFGWSLYLRRRALGMTIK